MENKWLDDIKKKLSDFEKEVPDGLWEMVDPSAKGGAGISRHAHRLRLYRYAAVIAVMVILGGFVAHLWHEDRNMDLSAYVSQNYRPENKRAEASGKIQKIAQVTKKVMPVVHNEPANSKPGELEEILYEKGSEETVHDDNDCYCNGEETGPEDNANNGEEKEIRLSLFRGGEEEVIPVSKRAIINKASNKTYSDNLSFGVMTSMGAYGQNTYYSNGGNYMGNGVVPPNPNDPSGEDPGNSNSPGDDPFPTTPPDNDDNVNSPGEDNSNSYGEGNSDSNNDNDKDKDSASEEKRVPFKNAPSPGGNDVNENKEDYTHYLPIKIGVTFLYHLSEKIGIETGLVYTYLSSDVKYASGGNYSFTRGEQSLHYLGIPVNLKYRPLSWKWFNVYLSGGVEFDKCVSATLKRYYANADPNRVPATLFNIQERPFQISVNASLGLQVNVTNFLGIYVEPGVSYYFKDGSSLNTIYKERPCDFNLSAGVRFTLGGR